VTQDYPRILVVTGNNFNLVTGGGITLTNLFRGWPADRLANLHDDATPVDRTVCRNFYRLTEQEIRWVWPFSLVRRSYGHFKRRSAGRRNPPVPKVCPQARPPSSWPDESSVTACPSAPTSRAN
jgi:hypothetical protein